MKKLFALIGSFALLSACSFTVTTEMNDGRSDDTVPAEEVVEEGESPTDEVPTEEAPTEEAPAEEVEKEAAPTEEDDGTVNGETNEDAGGDGTNTTGGEEASSEAAAE